MWKDFPQRLCDAAPVPRPRLLASRLRPLDAARRRRRLGPGLHAPPGARGAAGAARCPALRRHGCRRPGCSATATAARSRCCTRRDLPTGSPAPSCWRRTSWSRTCRSSSIARARTAYQRNRSAPAPGQVPRRPRLRVLGLERHLAAPAVQAVVDRRRNRVDPLPAAGGAGPGRRIRHARTDPRHPRTRAAQPCCSNCPTAGTVRTATSPSA